MRNSDNSYVPLTIGWDSEMEDVKLYLDWQTQWATDIGHAVAYFEGNILISLVSEEDSELIIMH